MKDTTEYSAYQFYKGEQENPFRRGTLRHGIWEWERKFAALLSSDDDEAFAWWDYCHNVAKQPTLWGRTVHYFSERRQCENCKDLLKEYMAVNYPKAAIPFLKQTRLYKGEPAECHPYEGSDLEMFYFYEQCWVRFNLSGAHSFEGDVREYHSMIGADFEAHDGVPLTFKALLLNRYMHWSGGYGPMEKEAELFKEWYRNSVYHRRNYKKGH